MDRRIVSSAVLLAMILSLVSVRWSYPAGAATMLSYARPLQGGFDSALNYGLDDARIMHDVYEGLVTIDDKNQIRPALAVSWTVSSDFKTYTFKLRPGVKFHDGSSLTANAVKFSFLRILKIDKTGYGNFRTLGQESGLEALDPLTIRITLKESFPLFMVDLLNPCYFVMSDSVATHATSDDPYASRWLTNHEAGTGPFRLAEWVQDDHVVLAKFSQYWGGAGTPKSAAKVDTVIIRKVPDPSAARIMLEKGEVDIAEGLTQEQFAALEKTKGITVNGFKRPALTYLTMDVRQKPFDSVKVRQAIAYAINYDEIIKKILHGYGTQLHGLMAQGQVGYDPSIPAYPYDPAKARQLLKDAGYPSGFSTELTYAPGRAVEFDQVAQYLQAYLGKVGIQLKLQRTTIEAQVRNMDAGSYGLSLMIWNLGIPDPDDGAGNLYDPERSAGGNDWIKPYWSDPTAKEKMTQTRATVDPKVRASLYHDVSMIIVNQAIYIPLYQPQYQLAWRSNLKGMGWDPFMGVRLWQIQKP
jgi:peptide/nickel transport system substrate-binding protein